MARIARVIVAAVEEEKANEIRQHERTQAVHELQEIAEVLETVLNRQLKRGKPGIKGN